MTFSMSSISHISVQFDDVQHVFTPQCACCFVEPLQSGQCYMSVHEGMNRKGTELGVVSACAGHVL